MLAGGFSENSTLAQVSLLGWNSDATPGQDKGYEWSMQPGVLTRQICCKVRKDWIQNCLKPCKVDGHVLCWVCFQVKRLLIFVPGLVAMVTLPSSSLDAWTSVGALYQDQKPLPATNHWTSQAINFENPSPRESSQARPNPDSQRSFPTLFSFLGELLRLGQSDY